MSPKVNGYVKILESVHAGQLATQKAIGEQNKEIAGLTQSLTDLHMRLFS